ncbi:hypothetical protein H5410_060907 [Solanum commersonii]|uniref:Uncharacterized protein n=1 Tax=Solanum commersonii TaxID=4109 RepID=A0A9J5W6A9_SOLCO|nr:hypothetical protein H5410_060907 [Solanum commersonii]
MKHSMDVAGVSTHSTRVSACDQAKRPYSSMDLEGHWLPQFLGIESYKDRASPRATKLEIVTRPQCHFLGVVLSLAKVDKTYHHILYVMLHSIEVSMIVESWVTGLESDQGKFLF